MDYADGDGPDGNEAARPARKRGRRRVAIGLGVTGLGVLALWSQRAPIATQLIDRELARRGVPARYAIDSLSADGASLSGLMLGNPARPDLIANKVRVDVGWGLAGAHITGVMLEDVLMRGRLGAKGLSLGSLDRLRPAPSGQPFRLPDLNLRLRNARLFLATTAGPAAISADGAGRLANGFNGRIVVAAPRLRQNGCTLSGARGLATISIRERVIGVNGPLGLRQTECGQISTGPVTVQLDAAVPETLDRAQGHVRATARSLAMAEKLSVDALLLQGVFDAGAARPSVNFTGAAHWQGLKATDAARGQMAGYGSRLADTPVGPLARQFSLALARAMADITGSAQLSAAISGNTGRISLANLALRSASGAKATGSDRLFSLKWPRGAPQLGGHLTVSGGGLPEARFDFQQLGPESWRMLGGFAPYAAGGARLALSGTRLEWNGSYGRFSSAVSLSGPWPGGTVHGLALPLDIGFGRDGSFRIGGAHRCVAVAADALQLASLRVGGTRLALCGRADGTLLAGDKNGRLAGDIGTGEIALNGRMGDAPLSARLRGARLRISGAAAAPLLSFTLGPAAVNLRQPSGETRLTFAGLDGSGGASALGGTIRDAEGNLAGVPLLIDQASGRWRLVDGQLRLDAPSARIRDAAPARRFEPVLARAVTLALKNGIITGNGALTRPGNTARLADVTLRHDLRTARGNAVLDVPGLVFGDDLQPEQLTPLTLGVIANVGGDMRGRGNIRWAPSGVTSDGVFETGGIGLSAAFGQVHNIKGRIVFDDLLGMTTPPGQTAAIGEMNPGVAVKDGVIRYQLLADRHVKIEQGFWPFSGGQLLLEPTVLDFSRPSDRIFTLTVKGLDAAQFIQQFDFRNFAVTGTFDGTLPLLFNEKGRRIVGGKLISRDGGTLAYVGEVSEADIGGAGRIAFDALKSLKYNALIIEMDGELDGEIVSTVLFSGTNQAPVNPTGSAIPVKATGLPFKFNITLRAPFRALLNTAQSFTDVRATVQGALPADPEPATPAVKP